MDAESLERLGRACTILDLDPIRSFESGDAQLLLSEAEVLVTGWGCPRIDASVLAGAPRLKLVAHAAGTVKALIDPAVFSAGIEVTNAASANAIPVAQFTLAAILFANKQVLRFRDSYRVSRARCADNALSDRSVGNIGRTIGIVGYSRIGARVIDLLRPHEFEVLLYDPHYSGPPPYQIGARRVELDEVMSRSDVVSLHAPSLATTANMIDAGRLALMQDGATLINTARGALIEQEALVRELVSGRISAVLDVTTPEVLPASSPLYDLPNVLLTPHIAGALGNERSKLGQMIVDEVERFVDGRPLVYRVTSETLQLQA